MSDPMDLTPHFVLAGAEPEKIVPSEFDIGVPLPAPTPPRLRTRFDPEGQGPRQGMSFGENVLGAWRSGTLLGAASEAADIYTARRPAAAGTEELQYGGEGLSAEENRQNAIDLTLDQIAYDLAPPRFTPQSVAGTLAGSAMSPETWLTFGLSGLLVRQFPALAGVGGRIVAQGVETAAVNTAFDPVVQGARVASGGQESFDPAQTALAPVIGFGLGAGARAVGEVPGLFRRAAPDAIEAPALTPLDTTLDDVAKALAPEAAPEVAAPRLGLDEPPAAPERAPDAAAVEPAPRVEPAMPEAVPPRVEVAAPEAVAPAPRAAELVGQPVSAMPVHRVVDAQGLAVDVAPVVVEARDLVASSDAGFDQTLQPRQRDRAASQAQIREIANDLAPERLGVSAEADRGAPIIGPDRMVESGNGRVMAIRRAYEQGTADGYRAWVAAQGVDVTGFEQPVLVRQRVTPLSDQERAAFTVGANRSTTLALSATERAGADASGITPGMIDLIRNPDELGALANRDFVRSFVQSLPQAEQGMISAADGSLSAEGLTRIRNAVLAKAYGDNGVLTRIAEATDDEVKSISNALVSAAPEWAKLRADIEAGRVRADVDLTPELMEAVRRTADLRAAGTKLDAFLAQQDAFDRLTEPVEAWMRMFYDPAGRRAAGSPRIAERLKLYAQEARKVSQDAGLDLGLAPVTARDIQALAAAKGAADGKAGQDQTLLFRSRAGDGEGGAVGGGAGRSGAGEGRRGTGKADAGRSADETDLAFRRRGQQQVAALPPDQVVKGRLTDSTGANPEASPRLTRLEDISRNLVDSFEAAGRTGRVMPGARGQYSTKSGMIRVRSVSDFDTIAHEVGHAFHLSPQTKASIDPIVKANRAEMTPLGAGDKAGDQEAFAELFRLYVANPRYAAQNYPKSAAALDTMLRDRFPEQFAAVERIRSQLEALYLAPSGELVKADTISIPPPGLVQRGIEYISPDRDPTGKTIYSVWDRLYTAVIDKMNPVNKAVLALRDIAGRNGRAVDLKPLDDAYLLLRETAGARASASFMAKHGVIAAGDIRPIDGAPSLSTGLEKALGQAWSEPAYNDFGAYLVARRMVTEYGRFLNGEIPNPPGKLSLADYRQAVADFEAKYPTFRDGAADIYAFQRAHLQRMFDKGLYSKDFYDAAINRADYVPFVRDMADLADETAQTGGRTSAGSDLSRSVMKTFKGSERSVYDPISSIFQKIHDLEFVAARNDVVNALAKLGEAAGPGAGFIAEPIPNTQLKGQKVDVIEALRSAGKRANMDDADLGSLILQVEDALGDSTITTLFRAGEITPGGEPIVFRWEGGERRALRLADGRFGQSMYHALTAMSEPERNWFALALQLSQQMLRAGVTRAADFVMANFIRDQFSSTATAGRRYIPFISAVKGVHDILSGSQAAMDYAARGGFSGGAITDVIEASNLGRNVRSLDGGGVLKQMGEGNFGEGARRLLAKSAKGLEISEGATRVGLFKSFYQQAKDIGWDDANAVFYATHRARDYIDFQRSGAAMDTWRRWIPFLNAAIQGTDKETRSLANLFTLERRRSRGETLSSAEMDQLKDARVAWVRVMAMGAILGTGTALLGSGEPEYENASRYAKDGSFLIKMGDYWLSIPKPFGAIQAIVNAFERGTEGAIRREPSLAGDWLASAASGFVPPMSNPLVTQVYDVPANYDRFRESPIVPFFLQGVKPSEQYLPGTAELAKFIGSVTNWSPLKIEYVIRNMGGSMALDFLKGTDALMGKDAPEKQIYDYPVLRRFVKNLARGSAATREFYNLVGEKNGKYEQAEGAYRQKVRDGERAGAATFLAGLPDDEKIWTTLSTSFEANEQRLHPMRNARDRVSVFNGMISQLTRNNLLEEDKLKRGGQMTIQRRDATPIPMTPEARARVIEDLQEASMLTARNAMIAVGAKGTKGLDTRSLDEQMNRIKAHSPAAYAELERRLTRAKVYDFADVAAAWPELKRRILADGEKADLKELRREAGKPSAVRR